MDLRPVSDGQKIGSELRCQACGVVAADRQTAAFLGTVGREGGDDDVAARPGASAESAAVGGAIGFTDQEMEDGAIVPDVERAVGRP